MAYEDLYDNTPIEKMLALPNKEPIPVYFKRLTAGEEYEIRRGKRGVVKDGQAQFDVDWGDIDLSNQRRLLFSHCDEKGKNIFKSLKEVQSLPGPFFAKLLKLCNEALEEPAEGNT